MDDLSFLEHLILNYTITSTESSLSRYILAKLFSVNNENNIKYVIFYKNFCYEFIKASIDSNIIFCESIYASSCISVHN